MYFTVPFDGKSIKCYISDVVIHSYGDYTRDIDGIIHREEIKQYEFKVLSV